MALLETTIEVKRPIQDVFAYWTNVQTWTEWNMDCVKAEQVTSESMRMGTQLKGINRGMGREFPWTAKVTEYKPPERYSMTFESGFGTIEEHDVLSAIKDETKFQSSLEIKGKGLFKPLMFLYVSSFRKQNKKNLAKFKDKLETQA